jgi:hypothetical protein
VWLLVLLVPLVLVQRSKQCCPVKTQLNKFSLLGRYLHHQLWAVARVAGLLRDATLHVEAEADGK